jgi:DNA-binding response OmpR family regulator
MRILLVEDHTELQHWLSKALRDANLSVECADNGADADSLLLTQEYALVILDLTLPRMDGLEVLKRLRARGGKTPVLILTARGGLEERVQGLNLGADDYLAKPFYVEELIARIHALLRRVSGERQNVLSVGALKLDRLSRVAELDGREVELTSREFNLMEYLMRSPGRVYTRTQILEHVWGYDFEPQTNMVDVCIQRLRKKLNLPENIAIEAVRRR